MRRFAAAMLLAAVAGCATDPSACCGQYPMGAGGDRFLWCDGHRKAAARFVQDGATLEDRRKRLGWLKVFVQQIEPFQQEDTITEAVQKMEKAQPDFWKRYDQEHFWAVRDTNVSPGERAEIAKEGFRQAVRELETELGAAKP